METANEEGGKQPSSQTGIIIVAVVIILCALILARVIEQSNREDEAVPNTQTEDVAEETKTTTEEVEAPAQLISNYETPESFADRKEAEEVINSTQGKTTKGDGSETIVAGIVSDDKEENVRYFATSSLDKKTNENFVGIYGYNTSSNRWWRLYKKTYKPNEDGTTTSLRVIGKEGRNLIVAVDEVKREAQACESLWLLPELVLVNMDDAYAGFKTYTLPETIKTQEEQKRDQCLLKNE